jgi:sterol desaturase/sphingolipid hydroxylase (fatty acid hydroxylase superfamily)
MNTHPTPTSKVRALALHAGVLAGAATSASLARRLERRSPAAARAGMAALIVGSWGAVAAAERRWPYRRDWNESKDGDSLTDLQFFLLGAVPSVPARLLGLQLGKRLPRTARLRNLPGCVSVPIAILGYDLAHTLHHRLGHEWGPGWTVHSVHHSPLRLYWFNASRFHWIEVFLDLTVEALIGAVMPLRADHEAGYFYLRAVYGQIQHANIDVDSGVLSRVFSTPELHRWHHSQVYEEGDTNYGAVVSVWDQLLGSYYNPDRPNGSLVGVGRMPRFPTSWGDLQRAPFRWKQIKEQNAEWWYADGVELGRRPDGDGAHT